MSTEEKKMFKLMSSDREEFQVEESVAIQSELIKNIIEDDCGSTMIPLPNVDGKTLAKIIEYCNKHADDNNAVDDLKKFDTEFVDVDVNVLFDLLMAANYMSLKGLLDLLVEKTASLIRGKTPDEIRSTFNIKNDFTTEEYEAIVNENSWAFQ